MYSVFVYICICRYISVQKGKKDRKTRKKIRKNEKKNKKK